MNKAKLLSRALTAYTRYDDLATGRVETISLLSSIGISTLPVRGGDAMLTGHEHRDNQKAPAGRDIYGESWSSRNPLPLHSRKSDISEAMHKANAYAYGVIPSTELIIIDADTPEQVYATRTWLHERGLPESWEWSVKTPGLNTIGDDGKAKHRDGGHLYIILPEESLTEIKGRKGTGEIPGGAGQIFGPGNRYLLGPGSQRADVSNGSGLYISTGTVVDGSRYPRLIEGIREVLTPEKPKQVKFIPPSIRVNSEFSNDDDLSRRAYEWSAATPWASLATQLGWTVVGPSTAGGCGSSCIDIRDQGGANTRGGIAHEIDCPLITGTTTGIVWAHSDTLRNQLSGIVWTGSEEITATKWNIVKNGIYGGDVGRMFRMEQHLEDKPLKKTGA